MKVKSKMKNTNYEIMYPNIHVQLSGEDGNAFMIMAKVRKAMRSAGVKDEAIQRYLSEAMSGDYNNLLRVTMQWVDVS